MIKPALLISARKFRFSDNCPEHFEVSPFYHIENRRTEFTVLVLTTIETVHTISLAYLRLVQHNIFSTEE